jgi:drug/metabolite transporter (DMT)-like permease
MASVFTRTHYPAIITMAFFFGTNLVVSRYSLGQFHPLGFVSMRIAAAAVLGMAWSVIRYRRFPTSRRLWVHGSIVGVTATCVPMMMFVSALRYQSAGVTALFISVTPVAAMIFAHFRLPDDRLTTRKVLGAIISFAGVSLLLATGETGLGETHWEGFVLIAIGVASNAFGIVHLRKHLVGERSLEISAVRLLIGAIATVPFAAAFSGYDLSAVRWTGIVALSYGVILGTLVAFLIYTFVSVRFGPVKATQQEYLVPVFAVITGALFLEEQVSLVMVFGMIGVITGIAIATSPGRARPLSHNGI